MSILERSTSPPQPPAAEWGAHSDRLRVITAGRVGNMEARLGASGFDVVAVAETEDALSMPCLRTRRTRSSSSLTCATRSSTFESWHPMPCSSPSAITRPPARSVASRRCVGDGDGQTPARPRRRRCRSGRSVGARARVPARDRASCLRPPSDSRSILTKTAAAPDPPRSRSRVRRGCGSPGSSRTRRSGRPARSRSIRTWTSSARAADFDGDAHVRALLCRAS